MLRLMDLSDCRNARLSHLPSLPVSGGVIRRWSNTTVVLYYGRRRLFAPSCVPLVVVRPWCDATLWYYDGVVCCCCCNTTVSFAKTKVWYYDGAVRFKNLLVIAIVIDIAVFCCRSLLPKQ